MAVFYPIVKKVLAGKVEPKDYNFYDYDGTLLYSYTEAELASLAALPVLPKHEGLTCQGWNWTLDELKAEGKETDVGAIYTTDDGATRLYITTHFEPHTVSLYYIQSVAGAVSVDWGDGSAPTSSNSTTVSGLSHTYDAIGDYVITLKPISGTLSLGTGGSGTSILGNSAGSIMLKKVEVGATTNFSNYAFTNCKFLRSIAFDWTEAFKSARYVFNNCEGLKHINLPRSDWSSYWLQSAGYVRVVLSGATAVINDRVFDGCKSLEHIILPSNLVTLGPYNFNGATRLCSIATPRSLTILNGNLFYGCSSLQKVVSQGNITAIAGYTFYNVSNLGILDLTACTTVPTIQTTSFSGYPSGFRIYVPAALYDEWIVATNWAALADYIVAK